MKYSEDFLLPQVGQAEQASREAHRKVSTRYQPRVWRAYGRHASMPVQSQSHCLPSLYGHIYGLLSGTTWCRHPLNCEPPLSMLMDKGFITPVSIHYVRNHGAVPRLDWDTHKVKVRMAFHPACAMQSMLSFGAGPEANRPPQVVRGPQYVCHSVLSSLEGT